MASQNAQVSSTPGAGWLDRVCWASKVSKWLVLTYILSYFDIVLQKIYFKFSMENSVKWQIPCFGHEISEAMTTDDHPSFGVAKADPETGRRWLWNEVLWLSRYSVWKQKRLH